MNNSLPALYLSTNFESADNVIAAFVYHLNKTPRIRFNTVQLHSRGSRIRNVRDFFYSLTAAVRHLDVDLAGTIT